MSTEAERSGSIRPIPTLEIGHFDPRDRAVLTDPSDLFLDLLSLQNKEGAGQVGAVLGAPTAYSIPPERAAELEAVNAQARAAKRTATPTRTATAPRARVNGSFIKGPIPLPWMLEAAQLGKGAMKAGLLVWYVAGLVRSYYEISLEPRLWRQWFNDPKTYYRALERLEAAGLIDLDRRQGRSPIVSIRIGGEPRPTLSADYTREGNITG